MPNAATLSRLRNLHSQLMVGETVTVTFLNQTSPGVYDTTTLAGVWSRFKGLAEADPSKGVYVKELIDWYVPVSLHADSPTPGDLFQYAGNSYVVLPDGVDKVGGQGCWLCHTGRPFLQGGLTDTVTIYRPAGAKDQYGRFQPGALTVVASGMPVKIQEASKFGVNASPEQADANLGRNQNPLLGTCFLTTQVKVQPHDILQDQLGRRWSILADNDIDLLATFAYLQLKRLL